MAQEGSWREVHAIFLNNCSPEAWNNQPCSISLFTVESGKRQQFLPWAVRKSICWKENILCTVAPIKQNPLCVCALVSSFPGLMQAIIPVGVVLWEVFSPLREGMGQALKFMAVFLSGLFVHYLSPLLYHRQNTLVCLIRIFLIIVPNPSAWSGPLQLSLLSPKVIKKLRSFHDRTFAISFLFYSS